MNYRALLFFTLFICSIFAINSIESIFENTGEEKLGVIVILKNDSNTKSRGISSNELNTKIQNAISKTSIKGEIRELNIINGFSTEITAEEYALLMEDNSIEGIYYDYPVYISLHQSVPIINADDVWNMQYNGKTITGKGQTVCVIDTGVDYTNPYLVGKVIGGRNVIYNNNNYMDYHGHGTHCAGIIASTHPIYTGVAPDAKIVAVKALDDDGYGSDADVIDGINWCVTNRAAYNISVISMSLGGGLSTSYCDIYDVPTSNAINAAVAQNISVVIATGNEGNYGVCYPACVQNAIRVAASTKDNLIASYSNRGGSFNDILLAPGSFIYSTIPGGIGQKSGTSMATPHIAGVIALYNQYYYDSYGYYVSPAVIEQKIINSGYIIYDSGSGKNYARVDANELFSDESLFSYSIYPHKSTYSNSENLLFEINFSEPVSNVYVNLTLPNSTTEIILLSEISSTNYNGSYIIPNQHGNYSFVYIYNYSNEIFNSHTFNFQVLYDYICVNYSDCNSSLFEYDKVLLNNSLTLNSTEFFIIDENKEFSCNNNKIFNSSYLKFIGVNSRLKDCIFYSKEFNLNSSNSFYLSNVTFRNYSEIKFNSLINNGFIISLNDKVIANTINSNANYKINKSCDGLEIDVLRLNEITNSTSDFYDSNYFTTSCVNDLIEFNSTLNGSYTYNLFNLSVTNTTGGKTNTVYNFTYLFNVTNNNIINEIFTFNYSNNLQLFNLNSSNNTLIEFNVSKNISGNYTLNYSICSNKLNRCLNSNFITEVFDIPSFNEVSIFPYVIANNSNVTFNLNVSNSKNIWFKIDLPNGSSFTDSYYAGYNYTTNQIGRHNITFYANDTFNYISEYEDYFEVLKTYISNFTFKDSEGNLTNVTLKLYYRNQQIFNFNIDNSSIGIFDLLYDLEIDFLRLRLIFENSNLTNNSFNSIYDEVKFGNYFYTLAINNSFNFQNDYTIEINYSGLNYTNDNYLDFYKCSDWDFINNLCNGVFENKNYKINKTTKIITYTDNTFSSFSLLQDMYCGDDACNNGETCSSCKTDCGACYSGGGGSGGGSGGGGGGGGTGGGSAILPKDAKYKNITLDYTKFNVIENENYIMYVQQNQNNYSYSFYSNYYGELCFKGDCMQIKPFEFYEINSNQELNFEFKKQKLDYPQFLNFSIQTKYLDINKIKFYLQEFNNSRTFENKCAAFLGYHISPCVDKESCLFACRSIPLCSGMSNSEIFLDFSKFVYINRIELNQLYLDCYSLETNNTYDYNECVEKIYGKAKEIESSPLFGTCPTCLGVCDDLNYSFNSLDEILILLNDYEKVISYNVTLDISKYNEEADELNSLLEKNNIINEKVSYSKKEIQDLIYLHNDYEIISSDTIKLINDEMNEILENITLYNEMNCTSEYSKFLNLNHFNNELGICLSNEKIDLKSEEVQGCEGCGEPDFTSILTISLILIVILFLFKNKIMKRYH